MLSQFKWLLQSRIIFRFVHCCCDPCSNFHAPMASSVPICEAMEFEMIPSPFFFFPFFSGGSMALSYFEIFAERFFRLYYSILAREIAGLIYSHSALYLFFLSLGLNFLENFFFFCSILALLYFFFRFRNRCISSTFIRSLVRWKHSMCMCVCRFLSLAFFCAPETDVVNVFINSQHTIIAQLKQSHHINMHVFIFYSNCNAAQLASRVSFVLLYK